MLSRGKQAGSSPVVHTIVLPAFAAGAVAPAIQEVMKFLAFWRNQVSWSDTLPAPAAHAVLVAFSLSNHFLPSDTRTCKPARAQR